MSTPLSRFCISLQGKVIFVLTITILLSFKLSAQTISYINGINKSGNNVSLGGILTTADASIDLGSSYFFKLKKSTRDYLTVINSGNIVIGTDNPVEKLNVNGNAYSTLTTREFYENTSVFFYSIVFTAYANKLKIESDVNDVVNLALGTSVQS